MSYAEAAQTGFHSMSGALVGLPGELRIVELRIRVGEIVHRSTRARRPLPAETPGLGHRSRVPLGIERGDSPVVQLVERKRRRRIRTRPGRLERRPGDL